MSGLGRPALLEHLAADVAAFERCLAVGDHAAPVAACPGWDLGELGTHLGRTHRWARAALASTTEPRYAPRPAPGRLLPWFGEGAAALVADLRAARPEQPCWSFAPGAGSAAFWVRRQAHETAMHRWDAETALGAPARIDPGLAADGVAEALEVFVPRQVSLGRQQPLAESLTLLPSDADGEWRLGGEGASARLRAPAEVLLLLLWKRRGLDAALDAGAQLDGDHGAAQRVLAARLTP